VQQLGELAAQILNSSRQVHLRELPRTRVTVQVGKASTLAPNRVPTGIVGTLQLSGANGAKINRAICHSASGNRRSDPDWKTETINERDIVEVVSVRLAQGEFGESDRRDTLFSRERREQVSTDTRGGGT